MRLPKVRKPNVDQVRWNQVNVNMKVMGWKIGADVKIQAKRISADQPGQESDGKPQTK